MSSDITLVAVLTNIFQVLYTCLPGYSFTGLVEKISGSAFCGSDGFWNGSINVHCSKATPFVSTFSYTTVTIEKKTKIKKLKSRLGFLIFR